MGRSQESFSKKEKEKKKLKKREEKQKKKLERKEQSKGSDFESMLAYVDENGNLTDTPPDPTKKKKVKAENIDLGVPKKEKIDSTAIRKGRVDFFNDSKGYGFIIENDSNEKHFVHVNGLLEEIKENDKVTFNLEQGLKGLNAVNVKRV